MPGLIIDKVGGGRDLHLLNIYGEGSYEELKLLKEEGKLVPGQKYLLKNYQTKYLINGSDTSPIREVSACDELLYGTYHHFASGIEYPALDHTNYFTVVSLPDSYNGPVQPGEKFKINNAYEGGYFDVPGLPLVIGMEVSYQAAYYENQYINDKVIKERFYQDLSGTITSVADTDIINGVGTLFTQELEPGDSFTYFVDAGYRYDRVVKSIESDTQLTMTQVVLIEDIATDTELEKLTFGKVIMQPGGLLNTDVHDGTPYSGMTAEENAPTPVEDLILVADSNNQFSRFAESLTFAGDKVEYLFDDKDIYDRASNLVATRPGLVIYRENKGLKVGVDKDWRAQKYRRFRANDKDWEGFDYRNKNLYKLASEAKDGGNPHTYYVGGINGLSKKEEKRYFLRDLQYGFRSMDFTRSGEEENPFTSGFLGSGSWGDDPDKKEYYRYSALASQQDDSLFAKDFWINFNEIEVKDYPIIPLAENYDPKPIVVKFYAKNLDNSVFLDHDKAQGVSKKIDVDCNHIQNSIFFTGGKLTAKTGIIEQVTSLEDFEIINSGNIKNLLNFSSLRLINNGELKVVQFGGAYSYPVNFCGQASFSISASSIIVNSVFGIGHGITYNYISDTTCKDVLFRYFALANNIIKMQGVFFTLANSEDHDFIGNAYFQKAATAGCVLELTPGFYRNTGLSYWLQGAVRDIEIKTKVSDKSLYYEKINPAGLKSIMSIAADGIETEQAITIPSGGHRLKDAVLLANAWVQNVVTGTWEYIFESALLTGSTEVEFIPHSASLEVVTAAEISPFTPVSLGSALVTAKSLPTADIAVDVLIQTVKDV